MQRYLVIDCETGGFVRGAFPDRSPSAWAHNAEFDKGFLMAAHERINERLPVEQALWCPIATDWRCSRNLFRTLGRRGFHDCRQAGLDAVLSHYGIQIDPTLRHTALGDAIATAQAIARMHREQHGREEPAMSLLAES